MSEWIDFFIYAASSSVLWIMLPWATRDMAMPVMMARNPEWVAANPQIVQRIGSSRWFTNTSVVWGFVSVGVLLLARLDMTPQVIGKHPLLWQQLNNVYNLLFLVGAVFFGITGFIRHLRFKKMVPEGERRSASLQPRSAADFVPRFWRSTTDVLTAALLVTWLILGVKGAASSAKHWEGFAFMLVFATIIAVLAHAAAARPPNYLDRLYGPAYRHREVRVLYGARLGIVLFGAIILVSSTVGPEAMPIHPVRLSFLLFQGMFVAFLLAFALLKPAGSAPPTVPTKMRTGLTTSLIMLILVPILAAAGASLPGQQQFALRTASHSLPIQAAVGRIVSVGLGALAMRTSE
jgi:hypothetical protein